MADFIFSMMAAIISCIFPLCLAIVLVSECKPNFTESQLMFVGPTVFVVLVLVGVIQASVIMCAFEYMGIIT